MNRQTADKLLEKLGVAVQFKPLLDSGEAGYDGVSRFEMAVACTLRKYENYTGRGIGVNVPPTRRSKRWGGDSNFRSVQSLPLAVSQFKRVYGIENPIQSPTDIANMDYGVATLTFTKIKEIEARWGRDYAELEILNTSLPEEELNRLKMMYSADHINSKVLQSPEARVVIDSYGKQPTVRQGFPRDRTGFVKANVRYIEALLATRMNELLSRAL